MGRILGIDYGDRRVGVALSDTTARFARPLRTLDASGGLIESLRSIAEAEEADRIVLGLPRNMDGSLGPKARQVLHFKERLEAELGLPVETWDERLTTAQAMRLLNLSGLKGREKARRVDQVAAQVILQSYLDANASAEPKEP